MRLNSLRYNCDVNERLQRRSVARGSTEREHEYTRRDNNNADRRSGKSRRDEKSSLHCLGNIERCIDLHKRHLLEVTVVLTISRSRSNLKERVREATIEMGTECCLREFINKILHRLLFSFGIGKPTTVLKTKLSKDI